MTHPKYNVYENKDYDEFIRSKPCLVKGTNAEPHHVWHARRNCYSQVPLSREPHDVYHTRGGEEAIDNFEAKYNINLLWEIINLLAEYIDKNR